ncbi:MAG: hypothetical protein ACTS6G_03340 [Candidatus Hodgkinia cicadicola]
MAAINQAKPEPRTTNLSIERRKGAIRRVSRCNGLSRQKPRKHLDGVDGTCALSSMEPPNGVPDGARFERNNSLGEHDRSCLRRGEFKQTNDSVEVFGRA